MVGFQDSIRGWELVALIAILVVAITARVWQLDSAPPGLTHDEASNGHDAAAVLRGICPIYFTVGYGHEPLYPYSVAPIMALLGPTVTALRLTTVLWGTLLILLSYVFTRRLFGSLPALLAAAWMAVSFWCVMTSRVGLRAITAAAIFAASAYSFWRAVSPRSEPADQQPAQGSSALTVRSWPWCILSGVFLGASIYTYMASRAMPAVYGLFLVYLAVLGLRPFRETGEQERRMSPQGTEKSGTALKNEKGGFFRRPWFGIAVLLVIAAVVAAPLIRYLVTHPEAEQRIGQLSAPLHEAARGDFRHLWNRLARSLPMLTFRGDPLWLYNIPGRPLLDVAGGPFFYAGFLVCLWRWRNPRYAFVLLWLVVGVGPALVTGPDATVLRSIAAQPAVFIIAALGLATIVRFFHRRAGSWGKIATAGAVAVFFVVTGARTAHAYFGVWADHRDVRVAYHHALVEQARYLDDQPEDGPVALSSIYPGRFHDPYTMEVALRREDLALHWFDGRFALVFPPEEASRVIIPSIARLDETLAPIIEAHATRLHTRRLRSDDLVSRFDVYRFNSRDALQDLLRTAAVGSVYWSPADAFPTADPESAFQPLSLPVNLGGVVDLLGYDLRTPSIEAGGDVELLTVWRVRDALSDAEREGLTSELVAFTHVLDSDGDVVGQMDRLDVPSWHWRAGEAFVQLHRFSVDADSPPGLYAVEIGFYTRSGYDRLPAVVEGRAVDDRILLRSLELTER